MAVALAAPVGALIAAPAQASSGRSRRRFPSVIDLPDGWCPDGITAGSGTRIYVSSLADGAIYCADVRTGRGEVFAAGEPGAHAAGLAFDHQRRIWAACGEMGGAAVFSEATGACLAKWSFGGGYIADAAVTKSAVFFTDADRAKLHCVELGRRGALPGPEGVQSLDLPGGLGEAGACNNGIVAAWNGCLVIVQSNANRLFAFDPVTCVAKKIDIGGASVANADGLLLRGRTLYVVRNRRNVIAKFRLSGDLSRATLIDQLTDRDLDGPSAIAAVGDSLYAVNARTTTTPTPSTAYCVVRVRD
jgi:hypothetical protein